MKVSRSFKVLPLNWASLPDLRPRLERHGVKVRAVLVELTNYPDRVGYDSLEDAARAAQLNAPRGYKVTVHGDRKGETFLYYLQRGRSLDGESYIDLSVEPLNSQADLDDLSRFLGLIPDEPTKKRERSAFIAHRFDETGSDCTDKLARFLQLLGFSVQTGRAYSPKRVSDKVQERLTPQATVFVILTDGATDTWLIQESVLAHALEKPLFVLRDRKTTFVPGILADHEYIPFDPPHVESTFIPILEGLRELGYFPPTG